MVLLQGQGDLLQEHRLAGPRRRDDQAALPLADRRDQIDDARRDFLGGGLQDQAFVRVQRRQVLEDGRPDLLFRRMAVDRLHLHQGEVFLPLDGQANRALDHQAGAQAEPANLARARRRCLPARRGNCGRRCAGSRSRRAGLRGCPNRARPRRASTCSRTTPTMSCTRVMPVCSVMPSRSARANSLGIGKRYRSSSRMPGGGIKRAGTAPVVGPGRETAGGAGLADSVGELLLPRGLRRGRRRVVLPDPSSLRATAMDESSEDVLMRGRRSAWRQHRAVHPEQPNRCSTTDTAHAARIRSSVMPVLSKSADFNGTPVAYQIRSGFEFGAGLK